MSHREVTTARILTTGNRLKRKEFRNIDTLVYELLENAIEQIHLVSYVITDGAMWLVDLIEKNLQKGRSVKFIVNELDPSKRITERLYNMRVKYPDFNLVEFSKKYPGETIHAKAIVVDRRKAIIGSMNFTWGGMVGNHEIGVLIEGPDVEDLAYVFDLI
ncbi:phosphatidylserine/phosphatidylglycerophosphate/cardiolipin synthase family protein [Thermococcus sp. 2319x1]|uniref:phospholipase D-like domain-containing protein n=1 Tax=Thermococcus sp. 2319x1 TaxID=1674923 RepID=UPI0015831C30|nr:phospholipase D family protein [Thermococcus sp. 2319x1]